LSPSPTLHSFPTRRSSDLIHIDRQRREGAQRAEDEEELERPSGRRRYFPHMRLADVGGSPRAQVPRRAPNPHAGLFSGSPMKMLDRKSTRLNSSHGSISYA